MSRNRVDDHSLHRAHHDWCRTGHRLAAGIAVVAVAVGVASCTSDKDPSRRNDPSASTTLPPGVVTTTTPEEAATTLLTSTDGYLLAVDTADSSHNQFISVTSPTNPGDPASPSVSVSVHDQACFIDGTDARFAMPVEPGPGTGPVSTWGIFDLTGTSVGSFAVSLVTTLSPPSYQAQSPDAVPGTTTDTSARPYGCASLSDGRVATTDLGTDGQPNGQLTVWFGPLDGTTPSTSCKIDTGLTDPRGVWVDEQDRILVASSGSPTAGVWRYSRLPTAADAAGGCGGTDAVGAPTADKVRKDAFVAVGDHGLAGPSGIAGSADSGVFVSSAISGVINEYDANGEFRRSVLIPDPDDTIDRNSTFFGGTPLGMATDVDGTLYYADPGWVLDGSGSPMSSPQGGLIQALNLAGDRPRPELFLDALTEPTSLTIFQPSGGREGSPL